MTTRTLPAALLAIAIFMAPTSLAQRSQPIKLSGWQLLQTNDDQGLFQTRISKKGIRLDSAQFTILILGPRYQATVYNNMNKRYFVEQPPVKVAYGDAAHWKKIKEENFGEMPVTHYRSIAYREGQLETDLWTLRSPDISQPLIRSCVRCIALREIPTELGLPVKIVTTGASGQKHLYMEIKNVKKVSFGKDAFKPLEKYQRVNDFVALRADTTVSTSDQDVSELFQAQDGSKNAARKRPPLPTHK